MPDVQINTVGIISKPRTERAVTLVPALVAWLAERNIKVRLDEETAVYLGRRNDALSRQSVAEGAQLLIVLGGDGTLLAAARAMLGREIAPWRAFMKRSPLVKAHRLRRLPQSTSLSNWDRFSAHASTQC